MRPMGSQSDQKPSDAAFLAPIFQQRNRTEPPDKHPIYVGCEETSVLSIFHLACSHSWSVVCYIISSLSVASSASVCGFSIVSRRDEFHSRQVYLLAVFCDKTIVVISLLNSVVFVTLAGNRSSASTAWCFTSTRRSISNPNSRSRNCRIASRPFNSARVTIYLAESCSVRTANLEPRWYRRGNITDHITTRHSRWVIS